MTNVASFVAMTLFIAFLTEIIISRVVQSFLNMPFGPKYKIAAIHFQFYNGGPIFEMPMSGLIVHSFWNATSASWVFFNREALG